MKTRVLTGLVGGLSALAALLFFPAWAIRLLVVGVCGITMYELLQAGGCKHKGIGVTALLFAAACPFFDVIEEVVPVGAILVAYALVLAVIQVAYIERLPFAQTMFVFATSIGIVLPIATLAYIRALPDHGKAFVFLPLIVSWFADMGAYFAGTLFGKHKLCPKVSPKKTVEGLLGGMVAAVLFALLGAWIYQLLLPADTVHIVYWRVALFAFVISPASVMGDLLCSVIKRAQGIKDYGNLFPGHGGMLDRFDSLIFVAPIVYYALQYIPMIQ